MALAGERHVDVAIELHAHRAAGLQRRERGERGQALPPASPCRRSRRPCAATARRPGCAAGAARARRPPAPRTDAASTRTTNIVAVLAALGPRRLGLEVEVLLAADLELAFERAARSASAASQSPRRMKCGSVWKLSAAIASRDREDRRQRLVFDLDLRRGRAAGLQRLADDQRDELAVEEHLVVREQRLVVAARRRRRSRRGRPRRAAPRRRPASRAPPRHRAAESSRARAASRPARSRASAGAARLIVDVERLAR